MKLRRIVALLLVAVLATFALASCGGDDSKFTVTFNSNGGTEVASVEVDKDTTVTVPTAPTKAGFVFDGWYADSAFTNAWNFDTDKVSANITLYAKWTLVNTGKNVMSYAEYVAADIDSLVVVEAYIQAKQSWWFDSDVGHGKGTFYLQDQDGGAYFLYDLKCTEEEYNALTVGTKVQIEGYKAEWNGEVEIVDATCTIIAAAPYIAPALDITDKLDGEDLIDYQNSKVAFNDLTVSGEYMYKWNGSGKEGDDLYFKADYEGKTYTFVVESYLCNKDSDVYKAVKELKVGDVIDMEGFLYWYDGMQPHITSVSAPVMSHAEYAAAEIDSLVTVKAYIQAKQSWWFDSEVGHGKGTFYLQDKDGGAYFLYELECTEEEYNALTVGTKVQIEGYKAEWNGEVEIIDATYTAIPSAAYIAPALDITDKLDDEDLIDYQNSKVAFKGLTVSGEYKYKWNGSGKEGDDLYFNVDYEGKTYTFVVESYLCNKDSDVYKAVKELKVGDVIDMEGFLYWYDGMQPHITSVTVK